MPRCNIPRPWPRCGACIVLHAQCPPRCFFAPYFSHEEGSIDFSVIHRVFGVSNASLLLYRLPARDQSEEAVSLTIEALARLQDPVYGCVSHTFALQQQANLSISLWGDALLTAAYILNRVPSKSVPSTPYEFWTGRSPNLDHLQPWGSDGYVHSTSHRYGKLRPRASKKVLIRYPTGSKRIRHVW
ncbi:LOB domain-containing protein 29-like [Diospyros lotus]|uniref:LOB domain-containing protein 29-like n=1 Tax=Diospyros lotus TaxID=55363 RepID=UPI00224CBB0E|nr:LOB domain-containing protein 29-like [Diospyros lotus]